MLYLYLPDFTLVYINSDNNLINNLFISIKILKEFEMINISREKLYAKNCKKKRN